MQELYSMAVTVKQSIYRQVIEAGAILYLLSKVGPKPGELVAYWQTVSRVSVPDRLLRAATAIQSAEAVHHSS